MRSSRDWWPTTRSARSCGCGGLRIAWRSQHPGLQLGRALLAVVESASFVLAFRYLPLADTHAIAAISPLIVIALGALFLGERVPPSRWIAVLVGFGGVLLIVRPGFRTLDWPLLIPVAGAVLWGSYQILTRLVARADTPDTTLVWSAFVAFIVLSFVGPFEWHWPDPTGWLLLLATGLLGALAHYSLIRALDYAEASRVQPFSYTLLVWVTILGALVFGDIPDHWTLLGAAIIVGSGLYAWCRDRQAPQRTANAATS
jgi:drug/metabolite transporter (DMT)-like permease